MLAIVKDKLYDRNNFPLKGGYAAAFAGATLSIVVD